MRRTGKGIIIAIIAAMALTLLTLTAAIGMPAPGKAMAAITATRTPTRTVINTPSPTPIDRNALLASLARQLSFGGAGGGGGDSVYACVAAVKNYHGVLPAVLTGDRQPYDSRLGSICLVGLEMKGVLKVKVYSADGKLLGSAEFVLGDISENGATLNQTLPVKIDYAGSLVRDPSKPVIIEVNAWLPPNAGSKPWKVTAQSGSTQVSGAFQTGWPKGLPVLYLDTANDPPFGPFNNVYKPDLVIFKENEYSTMWGHSDMATLQPGRELVIHGLNLPVNQNLALAMYQHKPGLDGALAAADVVKTDSQGHLDYKLSIGAWMPPGLYHLTVATDPILGDPYVGPFLGIYAETCPGAPDSILLKGDTIEIKPDPPIPSNIRSSPGISGKIVGRLNVGETALILDDFRCIDKMVWWKVRTSNGVVGWTAEGKGEDRFIVPVVNY